MNDRSYSILNFKAKCDRSKNCESQNWQMNEKLDSEKLRTIKFRKMLCNAIDHTIGKVLADVLLPHTDAALELLMQLLTSFGIKQLYTDGWSGYSRLPSHYTQRIGQKHLRLRTRIQRLYAKRFVFQSPSRCVASSSDYL